MQGNGTSGILARLAASQGAQMAPPAPQRPVAGVNQQPGGAQQMSPDMAEAQIRDTFARNPQLAQQVQQQAQQLMASGELTPEEIQTAVRLAKLALRDPNMWPQIRQFAIQQGIVTEQEIPMQYDPGLVYTIIALGEALGAGQQQPQAQQVQPQAQQQQSGGYSVPDHVVRMKGQEFFDNLVGKYDPAKQ